MKKDGTLNQLTTLELDQLAYIKSNRSKPLLDNDKYVSSFNSKFSVSEEGNRNQSINDIIDTLTQYPHNEFLWSQLIDLHSDNTTEAYNVAIKSLNYNKSSAMLWLKAIGLAPEQKAAIVCREAIKALPKNPSVQLSVIDKAPPNMKIEIAMKAWNRVKDDSIALVIINLLIDSLSENPLLKSEINDIFEQSEKSPQLVITVMPFIDITKYETPITKLLAAEYTGRFNDLPELVEAVDDTNGIDLSKFPYSRRLLQRTKLTAADLLDYPEMPLELFDESEWKYYFNIRKSSYTSHWTLLLQNISMSKNDDSELSNLVSAAKGIETCRTTRNKIYLNEITEDELVKEIRTKTECSSIAWLRLVVNTMKQDSAKAAVIAQRFLSFGADEVIADIMALCGLINKSVKLPEICQRDTVSILETFWNEDETSLLWCITMFNIRHIIQMDRRSLLEWFKLDIEKIKKVFDI